MSIKKTVLVTGSSQGLGAEMIKAFSDEGANIVINYNNLDELEGILEHIK